MGLNVDVPDPPTLRVPRLPGDHGVVEATADGVGDDAGRENLATVLREGPWERAFREWAGTTS